MNKNKGIWIVITSILIVGISVTLLTNRFVKDQDSKMAAEAQYYSELEDTFAETSDESTQPFDTSAPAMNPMARGAENNMMRSAPAPGAGAAPEEPQAAEPLAPREEVSGAASDVAPAIAGFSMPLDTPPGTETVIESKPYTASTDTVRSPLEPDSKTTKIAVPEEEDTKVYFEKRLKELDSQIQKMRDESADSNTYTMKALAENELKLWNNELDAIYEVILDAIDDEGKAELEQSYQSWLKARDAKAEDAARKYSGGTLEGVEYTASLADSTRTKAYELIEEYADVLKAKEDQ